MVTLIPSVLVLIFSLSTLVVSIYGVYRRLVSKKNNSPGHQPVRDKAFEKQDEFIKIQLEQMVRELVLRELILNESVTAFMAEKVSQRIMSSGRGLFGSHLVSGDLLIGNAFLKSELFSNLQGHLPVTKGHYTRLVGGKLIKIKEPTRVSAKSISVKGID